MTGFAEMRGRRPQLDTGDWRPETKRGWANRQDCPALRLWSPNPMCRL